jgi:hypothetical protein
LSTSFGQYDRTRRVPCHIWTLTGVGVWRILTVTPTGEKVVTMPPAPRVAPPLTWRSAPSRDAIFVNSTGERLDRHAAERIVRGSPHEPGRQACRTPHFAHAFINAALNASVLLRDVQEAASHADPRATIRNDRGRQSLARHATSPWPRSSQPPRVDPRIRRTGRLATTSSAAHCGVDLDLLRSPLPCLSAG